MTMLCPHCGQQMPARVKRRVVNKTLRRIEHGDLVQFPSGEYRPVTGFMYRMDKNYVVVTAGAESVSGPPRQRVRVMREEASYA